MWITCRYCDSVEFEEVRDNNNQKVFLCANCGTGYCEEALVNKTRRSKIS